MNHLLYQSLSRKTQYNVVFTCSFRSPRNVLHFIFFGALSFFANFSIASVLNSFLALKTLFFSLTETLEHKLDSAKVLLASYFLKYFLKYFFQIFYSSLKSRFVFPVSLPIINYLGGARSGPRIRKMKLQVIKRELEVFY